MKAALWRRGVTDEVLPGLPGEWVVANYALVQAPIGPLARAVVRSPGSFGSGYYLYVTVQPLYVAMETWQANLRLQLGRAAGHGMWAGFDRSAEAPAALDQLAGLIRDEAVPYLAEHGTAEGFRELCRAEAAAMPGFGRVYLLRQQAATEALLGDYPAAAATLDEITATAAAVPGAPDWLTGLAAEAGEFRAALNGDPGSVPARLAATETLMRQRLGLPGAELG
jgi:hypothetical protein